LEYRDPSPKSLASGLHHFPLCFETKRMIHVNWGKCVVMKSVIVVNVSAAPLFAVSPGFSSGQFLDMVLGSLVSALLLAVLLPFAASLILDAIVLVLRRRGVRGLLVASGLTAAVVIAGVAALSAGGPTAHASFATSASFLLPWSCAIAAVAFLIRQVKAAIARL
jgi:hypothetical protein